MSREDVKIPSHLRGRIAVVATTHGLGAPPDVAKHFVGRGLDRYGTPAGPLARRLAQALESQGYASEDELIEHLLERGLRAYEQPATSPEALAARLRGLGYID